MTAQPVVPRFFALAVLVLLLAALPLSGQTAELVRDINVTIDPHSFAPSSDPQNLFAWQGRLFFAATQQGGTAPTQQGGSGTEPWVTDGTASGTQLLADVCPGACSSSPQFLGGVGNAVFFGASPDPNGDGQQLWRSDGTRAGTFPLADSTVQLSLQGQEPTVVAGGRIFFAACSPDSCLLWMSDGTVGGTLPVPGFGGARPQGSPVVAGGKVYVLAEGNGGSQVWVTDGTAAGTAPLAGVTPGADARNLVAAGDRVFFTITAPPDFTEQIWVAGLGGTRPHQVPMPASLRLASSLTAVGHRTYFLAADASQVSQLWVVDGTRAGTRALTAFTQQQAPEFAELDGDTPAVAEAAGKAFFLVTLAPDNQTELWVGAATPAAAVKVTDVSFRGPLLAVGDRLLYTKTSPSTSSLTLWSTDGTPGGSRLLARGLSCCGDPGFTVAGGAAFFAADQGFQLWRTDGTPGGTRRFTGLPSSESSDPHLRPSDLAMLGSELFFSASGPYGQELWKSNGAPGGTLPVTDIARTEPSSSPAGLAALGGQLLFGAFDGTSRQLWQSTGNADNTSALSSFAAFDPGFDDMASGPQQLVAAGATMFFWRLDNGYHLWRTDGTAAGTLLLRNFETLGDPISGPPPPPAPLGGRIFFSAPGNPSGTSLWASDGTQAGTGAVVTLPDLSSPLANLTTAGGRLFFVAVGPSPQGESRLYASDGTPAGTALLFASQFQIGSSMQFTAVGSTVFFILTRDTATRELWKTDGTPSGTAFVTSLFVGDGSDPQPSDLTAFGGELYFFANTSAGRIFFRSDGSQQGTTQLFTFSSENTNQGFSPPPSHGLTVLGDRLFFAANDGVHGRELWTSDGTAAGTSMLLDIFPGPLSSLPSGLTVAGGRLWFSADDGVHGVELWQSDGTAAGTRMVQDLASGADSSYPDQLTAAGNLLYFTADDGAFGRELWALPLSPAASGCQPTSTRLCLTRNRFQVTVAWRNFQGNAGMGTAVPLTADTGYFWFFSAGAVDLIVKVLDARALNQSFWVFYGALSNVEYTITVTDTATGLTRQYFNPAGQLASVGDINAFGPLGEFSVPPGIASRAARAVPPTPVRAAGAPARPTPAAAAGKRAAPSGTSCQPGPTRFCLLDNRFAVEAAWQDFQGRTGTGTAVPLSADTGYFWFFSSGNVEVVLKMIDGRALNGKFWVFYGALSSVQYTLTVTDTQTGRVRIYQNPSGQLASVADTGAF